MKLTKILPSNINITSHHSTDDWQQELADGISNVDELLSLLGLPSGDHHTPKKFPLRVPRAFVAKMQKGNAQDPLLLQVLPSHQETLPVTGYSTDPLDENNHNPIKGLLHKYRSRVLLTVTGACAVHCRYCFRQHFDYGANLPTQSQMQAVIDYIKQDSSVNEVLLSGGDPLNLNHRKLSMWLDAIATVPTIHTIRLHTRLPVVLPSRIDDELLALFANSPKKTGDGAAHQPP